MRVLNLILSPFSRLEDKESEGSPLRPTPALPSFDKDQDVLLFFKYYDPAKEKIYYMGHSYVSIQSKVKKSPYYLLHLGLDMLAPGPDAEL